MDGTPFHVSKTRSRVLHEFSLNPCHKGLSGFDTLKTSSFRLAQSVRRLDTCLDFLAKKSTVASALTYSFRLMMFTVSCPRCTRACAPYTTSCTARMYHAGCGLPYARVQHVRICIYGHDIFEFVSAFMQLHAPL